MIQPIVEGEGEVGAFPVLLRRLIFEFGCHEDVGTPFLEMRTGITQKEKFTRALQVVSNKPSTRAVIVLFDADGDCARDIIPQMRQWSQEIIPSTPCAVVMARQEYEAWFIAALESLRGKRRIRNNAQHNRDPDLSSGQKA